MNKKKILSLITALICVAVAAVWSVAFTGCTPDDGIHIETEGGSKPEARGELEIILTRERLETLTLDSDGVPVPFVNQTATDFTKNKDNIFGIKDDTLIGPGCYFSAHMTVANAKSYAFEYWLEIVPQGGKNLLADQIELTVTLEGKTFEKRTLKDGLTTKVFPKTEAGETAYFTVGLEYLDVKNNDETKNTTLAFDLTVHAKLA